MDFGIFLSGILGSAGVFSLIQFLVIRHDRKNDDLEEIKRGLATMKRSYEDTNVRVTRMELMGLIKDDPDNIDAILQVAEYYFIELDGNAHAHSVFEKWALKHGVAIGWLPKLTKGVKHGKKS